MSSAPEPDWVSGLRQATRSAAAIAHGEVEVMRGARPAFFDTDVARALSSALFAAFVVAAAIFRERVGGAGALDLIALLLRAASVAFVLRALIALGVLVRRARGETDAAEHTLAFGTAGILLLGPRGEVSASKADVLAVALPEQPEGGAARSPRKPLLLVLKPDGRPRALEIPPYFAGSQDILAARLTRWLARPESEPERRFERPKPNPEEQYARIARGSTEAGEVCVPEGLGYRVRAPYGALLGCLFAVDTVRSAGPMAKQLWPGVAAACALALAFLAGWFVWMNGRRKSRLGIAMALTREELLLRGKAGVVGIPWGQFSEIDVDLRLTWSPFYGSYPVRVLSLSTLDGERVLFDGGFLGIEPEHVAALCEGYRRKLV
ncbi:MAG: hypothetical protein QM778_08355 [Myxococcales bacterium]